MASMDLPIPLSDIESILAWVDTYKLSRSTKKINRDFSDAVLLAEILGVHYPKLVEMHNYPPRNSHSLKLNNWMTLNRKVLKKLKLSLCCDTMEQLAKSTPGIVERVLIMVRDKIRRDEDANKSMAEMDQNVSSGGSYYEACGDDDIVLVVPVKTRVNGVLEMIQKKVVSHESYLIVKEELSDATETVDTLKQKVEHLDTLLKLKEERIEELQKQLERKQARRKEVEALQNSIGVPFEVPPAPDINEVISVPSKPLITKQFDSATKPSRSEESKIPKPIEIVRSLSKPSITEVTSKDMMENKLLNVDKVKSDVLNFDKVKSDVLNVDKVKSDVLNVDKVKSDVFKEIEIVEMKNYEGFHETREYTDEANDKVTIEDTIQKEIHEIENNLIHNGNST